MRFPTGCIWPAAGCSGSPSHSTCVLTSAGLLMCRCLDRITLFVWAMLVTSFIIIMAMPAIMIASTSLILDRLVGTHFFNPAEGGDVLLWQHLFWFFGHPEVYIIFLPAVGMVSTMVATFARRPVFGYLALVMALVATAIWAFVLWVQDLF